MYHYPTATPGYGTYLYTTSPSSSEETHRYYPPPQYRSQGASAQASARAYGYQYPRRESASYPQAQQTWYAHSPPAYYPSEYYSEHYVTTPTYNNPPPAYHDAYVSSPSRRKSKSQRFFGGPGVSGGGNDGSPKRHASKRSKPRINRDDVDEAEDSPPYSYHPSRPAYYYHSKSARADPHFFYYQVPVYDEPSDPQPRQHRVRRPSQSKAHGTPSRPAEPPDSPPRESRTRRPPESKAQGAPSRPAEHSDSPPRESRTRRPSESKARGTPSRPAKPSDSPPKESRTRRPPEPKAARTWTRPAKSVPAKSAPTESKPAKPKPAPSKSGFVKPSAPKKSRPATAEDAARAGIPAGYKLDNWDPALKPMILLGSVYDPFSIGQWIYDWTVSQFNAASPIADIAGDIWMTFLKLASRCVQAEVGLRTLQSRGDRNVLKEFLGSADEVWDSYEEILRVCQVAMMRTVRREGGKQVIDEEAGREFVETMFGRDRELERTEAMRAALHHWVDEFEDVCEPVLRMGLRG